MDPSQQRGERVGLFVTCLADLFRPSVGFASVRLLEAAGYQVVVPENQTCCGQPAWNSGDRADAAAIAAGVIDAFADCDHVVVPSGSCAGTIVTHYPDFFRDDPERADQARALAARTHELMSFLVDVAGFEPPAVHFRARATYHDACSGLRELGVRKQPRHLLSRVAGLDLREMADTDVCCGFGGTFCVKYPEISERLVSDKVGNIAESGAEVVLAGDLGCLFNIAGRLHRLHHPIRAYHVAEVLAGMADDAPAIGEPEAR